jgi:hypothetical protein
MGFWALLWWAVRQSPDRLAAEDEGAHVGHTHGGMGAMHNEGNAAGKSELMGITHKLANPAKAYIAQLEAMAAAPAP